MLCPSSYHFLRNVTLPLYSNDAALSMINGAKLSKQKGKEKKKSKRKEKNKTGFLKKSDQLKKRPFSIEVKSFPGIWWEM